MAIGLNSDRLPVGGLGRREVPVLVVALPGLEVLTRGGAGLGLASLPGLAAFPGRAGERVCRVPRAWPPPGVLIEQGLDKVAQWAGILGRGAGLVRIAFITAGRVPCPKGGVPSTAAYRVAPSAHMSAGAPTSAPSNCSGAI